LGGSEREQAERSPAHRGYGHASSFHLNTVPVQSVWCGLAVAILADDCGVRLADYPLGTQVTSRWSMRGEAMAEIRVEPKRRTTVWLWILLLVIIAAGLAYYYFFYLQK